MLRISKSLEHIFIGFGTGFLHENVVSLSVERGEIMAKNRVIPFGYCMKSGEVTVDFTEAKAVMRIFEEYLNGSSLMQIAKLMESEKIRYSEDSGKWNKNMVKRIIENETYLGNDQYPKLISGKFFTQANEKRMSKATSVSVIPEDLQEIRNRTYCLECGHRLSRIGGNSRSAKWDCRNPDCYRFEYQLTDQMIIGAVLTVMNTVIANPNLMIDTMFMIIKTGYGKSCPTQA